MHIAFELPPAKHKNRIRLPQILYRLAYADSAGTVIPEPDHAITTYAEVEPRNFDEGDTLRRHLLQRCFKPPWSSFVSFSDSPAVTQKRIPRWYNKGARLINIIKISTEGMIPAVVRRSGHPEFVVWVSESSKPENGQPLPMEAFLALDPKPEVWISMSQIYNDKPFGDWWFRTSYQEDEWLIDHFMPKSRVLEVLPCKGTKVILEDEANDAVVTEHLGNEEHWWDGSSNIWRKSHEHPRRREAFSLDENSTEQSWEELEVNNGSGGGARSQRKAFNKRGFNPEWEDSQNMTRPCKKARTEIKDDDGNPSQQSDAYSEKELEESLDLKPLLEGAEASEGYLGLAFEYEKGEDGMDKGESGSERSSKSVTAE
ncbi:hypothetical protein E8E13_003828 [Curvularia kusanoi]|uniref:Uncharacterized protein n=1 Tax=Curvularia kusanoi TaxID=90978 RepID=A0A9P4T8Y1_CURKU|nr:hypothetical protein E8E13_003828 [Curvularia kusanoi]